MFAANLHTPSSDGKVRVGASTELRAKMRNVLVASMILAACWSNGSMAASSCVLTPKDYADIAKLSPPISKDQQGNLVRGGDVLTADAVDDVCRTRRFYELVVAREAENKYVTADEFADGGGYVAAYLTSDEGKLVLKHMARVITELQRN